MPGNRDGVVSDVDLLRCEHIEYRQEPVGLDAHSVQLKTLPMDRPTRQNHLGELFKGKDLEVEGDGRLFSCRRTCGDQCSQSICVQPLFEKVMLRYDVLSEKRRPAIDHCFARGFLPNGGHPLVLFKWRLGTNVCILIVPDYRLVGLLDDTVRCSQ